MTKMYAYQKKLKDEESWANEGQVFGGVAIGIILFGNAGYALPPGSIENATTFKYPVHFTSISAASVESVVSPNLDPEVLSQLIGAGKYLETQGCRALIGACGYFANYLPEVISQLDTPCFFSSLMQIPMILKSLKPGKKVGILCANGSVLKDAPALANCGVDDTSKVVISGAEVLPEMQKVLDGIRHYNLYRMEAGLIDLAKQMVAEEPDIGAMLLECTLFPTHAWAIQEAVQLPVYDFTTLIDWAYSAAVRHRFGGHL